jgi:hypothetical protein
MRAAIFALIALWPVGACAGKHNTPPALPSTANQREAPDLAGSWTLRIEDLHHQAVVTMTIQFGAETAPSCMVGNWKRIVVTARNSSDDKFFPSSEPMSYELNGENLTIGRNEVCDDYLRLNGTLREHAVSGEYYSFDIRSRKRKGYFSLRKGP